MVTAGMQRSGRPSLAVLHKARPELGLVFLVDHSLGFLMLPSELLVRAGPRAARQRMLLVSPLLGRFPIIVFPWFSDEIVALKRLKMEKEKEGFPITSLREINTILKAQHPNIVTVRVGCPPGPGPLRVSTLSTEMRSGLQKCQALQVLALGSLLAPCSP